MTAAARTPSIDYIENGITSVFALPFRFRSPQHIEAKRVDADDVVTTLAYGTDYTVVGGATDAGGSLTVTAPATAGTVLKLKRITPRVQNIDYTTGDTFPADSHELALDTAMLVDQEQDVAIKDLGDRAILVPEGEQAPLLPGKAERASKFAAWDSQGVLVPVPGAVPNVPALASNIIADGGATVQEELEARAPYATETFNAPYPYPVEFSLGRDHPPHIFEYVPPAQHNGIIAFTSTYDCSADFNAMYNQWKPTNGKAGRVPLPVGRFALGQTIFPSNWVSLKGEERGTQFFFLSDHAGPYAFQFDSDPTKVLNGPDPDFPSSYFNQRLDALDINCNNAVNIDWVIYAPSWNEKCGMRDLLARNIPAGFLLIDEWHGGSAGFAIRDLELMFAASAYSAGSSGIKFNGRSRAGSLIINRPQVTMSNVTMAGATAGVDDANPGLTMIECDNIHLQLQGGIHFEKAKNGIIVDNNAMLTGTGATGSTVANRVVNMIARGSAHVGQIDLDDVYKGDGGTRVLRDFKTSHNITTAIGGKVCVPAHPGFAIADGRFGTDGAAIDASPAPTLRGCGAVTYESTGYFKVTLLDAFNSGDDYHVEVNVAADTACYGLVRASERAGSQFFIRVYRQTDDSLFDPTEVDFKVYPKPGL